MIGEYLYYFSHSKGVNDMFFHNAKKEAEEKKKETPVKDHQKTRKLSHEAAAQILDHEWKHHPGGG